jgi:polar amino acid transport system substrate-binding protein
MRSILVLATLLLLAACTRAEAPADRLAAARAAGVLRVGVLADAPPFGYRAGGQLVGFDIDLAHALAGELDIPRVELVPVTMDERSDRVASGAVDLVAAAMTRTRYRERRVDFTMPYFQDGQALLVAQGSVIQDYQDLGGATVAAVKGSTGSYYVKQAAPDCQVAGVAGVGELAAAVTSGRAQAAVCDRILLVGMVRQSAGALRLAGEPFTIEPYAIAVAENQSKLLKAVNHALIALWESGRYQGLYATWFGPGAAWELPGRFVITPYPR